MFNLRGVRFCVCQWYMLNLATDSWRMKEMNWNIAKGWKECDTSTETHCISRDFISLIWTLFPDDSYKFGPILI